MDISCRYLGNNHSTIVVRGDNDDENICSTFYNVKDRLLFASDLLDVAATLIFCDCQNDAQIYETYNKIIDAIETATTTIAIQDIPR